MFYGYICPKRSTRDCLIKQKDACEKVVIITKRLFAELENCYWNQQTVRRSSFVEPSQLEVDYYEL